MTDHSLGLLITITSAGGMGYLIGQWFGYAKGWRAAIQHIQTHIILPKAVSLRETPKR